MYTWAAQAGPIRQAGWMIWVGGALIRQALGNSMIYVYTSAFRQCPTLFDAMQKLSDAIRHYPHPIRRYSTLSKRYPSLFHRKL